MTTKTKTKLDGAIKKLKAIKPGALTKELFKPSRLEVLACIERDQLADFEVLLVEFHEKGFKGVTALRKAVKAAGKSLPKLKGDSNRDELLELPIKAAQLFRNEARPYLLYFQDTWLAWNQSHYEAVEDKLIRGEIWKYLEANGAVPHPRRVSAVLEGLQAICIRAKDAFNPPCWLSGNAGKPDPNYIIACPNGLLYLRTGKLLKHTPDFFTRNAINFPYDRNAPKPKKWLKRCDVIWADDHNQILLFQEVAGYGLTPDRRLERIIIFWGVARGGKTVSIKTLV
jgi:D5 N terminal like